eukprot:6203890-Pleurochrysis_carterae.AAC.1
MRVRPLTGARSPRVHELARRLSTRIAGQDGEHAPSERPHAASAASMAATPSSPEARSFSTAAKEETKIAGCEITV